MYPRKAAKIVEICRSVASKAIYSGDFVMMQEPALFA
jgi:hypothetical protein